MSTRPRCVIQARLCLSLCTCTPLSMLLPWYFSASCQFNACLLPCPLPSSSPFLPQMAGMSFLSFLLFCLTAVAHGNKGQWPISFCMSIMSNVNNDSYPGERWCDGRWVVWKRKLRPWKTFRSSCNPWPLERITCIISVLNGSSFVELYVTLIYLFNACAGDKLNIRSMVINRTFD